MEKGLSFKDVSVTFQLPQKTVEAVKHANLSCEEGKITCLIGESGSGKSVLGMAALRLLPQSARIKGEVFLQGEELLALEEKQMNAYRGRLFSFISQNVSDALDPLVKVGKQIAEPLVLKGTSQEEAKEKTLARLSELGFQHPDEVEQAFPFILSGGMCQRALCAMGTIQGPQWLIADEPTKGLDAILRKQVAQLFLQFKQEGMSLLIITHDLELAAYLADWVAVMKEGIILEQGAKEELFSAPKLEYTKLLLASRPSELAKKRWSYV